MEQQPQRARASSTVTLRHTTLGRTSLDTTSAERRDLYLKTNNSYNKETFMTAAEFEPTIPDSERPQTNSQKKPGIYVT